jgi:hypothetical protein
MTRCERIFNTLIGATVAALAVLLLLNDSWLWWLVGYVLLATWSPRGNNHETENQNLPVVPVGGAPEELQEARERARQDLLPCLEVARTEGKVEKEPTQAKEAVGTNLCSEETTKGNAPTTAPTTSAGASENAESAGNTCSPPGAIPSTVRRATAALPADAPTPTVSTTTKAATN